MPLYTFNCSTCGPFSELMRMSEAVMEHTCPHCGAQAPGLLAAPSIMRLSQSFRYACERSEKSADEPRLVSAGNLAREGRPMQSHFRCGCSCCS